MSFCNKGCRQFFFEGDDCNCKEFTIINADLEKSTQYATDHCEAALLWGKNFNDTENHNLMGNDQIITVNGIRFEVSAEASIEYYVKKLDE